MTHPEHADRHQAPRTTGGARQPRSGPAPGRGHVHRLLQAATFQATGDAARLEPMTVQKIAPDTRPPLTTGTARALLAAQPAGTGSPRVPANGPMWRLRSLIAIGHATGRITTALGTPAHVIEPLIRGDRATITTGLRDDISRLFEAWWDKRPPRRTPGEKVAACKARQRAALHDWPCPAALDEEKLDLPGYQPAARWRYACGTGTAAADPLGKNHPRPPPRPPLAGRANPHAKQADQPDLKGPPTL